MSTTTEYWQFVSAVADRLLEWASTNPAEWPRLVERVPDLPPEQRARAVELLKELPDSSELSSGVKEQIWAELDKLVRQHQKFATAEWSLPSGELDAMKEVADALIPKDPVDANTWLFDEHIPDVGVLEADFSERQEDLDKAREDGVRSVFTAKGLEGVLDLVSRVEYPWFVGTAAASALSASIDDSAVDLLDSEDRNVVSFAAGHVSQRIRREDWSWIEELLTRLEGRPMAQARLLQASDELERVWDRTAELDPEVDEAYWREFLPVGRGPDFALVDRAAEQLMKFGRPLTALDLMALYARKEDKRVSVELVAQGLEALVGLPEDHDEPARLSRYELETLLAYLRESNLSEDRIAVLEWRLLPALGFDPQTPTLERKLARDPEFFVEVLSLLYKPRNSEEARDVPEHLASSAWRLLSDWRIIPGSDERMGEIEEERLNEWIEHARTLLEEADRREIGDIYIGHVFSHSRVDEDGTWPSLPVRDAIERLASTEVEDGFATQIYNNRGVTSRGLLDGGAQERELVEHYRGKAELIRDEWPRTAAVLMSVSSGYESDAQRNDAESERWREGLY